MEQYLSFVGGEPVLTTGDHCTFVFISILRHSSFPPHLADSPLAKALKSPVSIFAATSPEKFTSISEITSLSLAYSNVVTLPESLCNPHPLSPFITLSHVTHVGSFLSFTVSLTNLVDLDLHGNDNLDFGALSQWLDQSSIIFLDLRWIPQWIFLLYYLQKMAMNGKQMPPDPAHLPTRHHHSHLSFWQEPWQETFIPILGPEIL